FFAALRRAFGLRVAAIGTLLLGLDHVNLLYNRMALMDTPAALGMVCAFYAFVRSLQSSPGRNWLWAVVCGLMLGLTFATRGLAAFLLPVPFLVLPLTPPAPSPSRGEGEPLSRISSSSNLRAAKRIHRERRNGERVGDWRGGEGWKIALGLAVALIAYLFLWYLPHRAELAPASHYYLQNQLNPHSLLQAGKNLMHALFGDERGMSPYLFRHTPVQYLLALAGLLAWGLEGRRRTMAPERRAGIQFLGLWLLAAWAVLAVVSYSPSRYYVLFYPALAGVAALALASMPEVARTIVASRWERAILGGFAAFHLAEAFLHRQVAPNEIAVYVVSAAVLIALWFWPLRWQAVVVSRRGVAIALALWAAVNLFWTGDWLTHLSYKEQDAGRWLAANLPPGSVLIGDVAPGLCLNNRFVAVNVIPGLCNDRAPVERFAPAPRYIAILDGKWKERWWLRHYPQFVAPQNRIHLFPRLQHWPVGIYRL
ncbi:MAG TPA: glycosyltransferase family 39 protein, partial [Chthonomonadaceae bacterium]|nr:glycosyltransferase family 39 protein [Chthonomonadaceae bacterium]